MKILRRLAVSGTALIILFYGEGLIFGPIIIFGPIRGGGIIFLVMPILSLLVAMLAGGGQLKFIIFRQKLANKSKLWEKRIIKWGLASGFLLSSLLAGGLITTFILKQSFGINGFKLKALAILSSGIFAIFWTGFYTGIWRGLLYLFR